MHIHGGVGIDTSHRLHRYFTAAKRNEFALGGATAQLRRLGASCDWSRERFTMDEGLSRAVRRVFVAHPIQDATDEEMRAKADAVIDQILAALLN